MMKTFLSVKPAYLLSGILVAGLVLGACRIETWGDRAMATHPAHPESVRTALLQPGDDALADEDEDQASLSDESLYLLDSHWSDQTGASIKLASLQGEPVVLAMVFTHCGSACPMIVHDMKKIAARLPEAAEANVRFVLVSLDPERDTPEVLAHFARAHNLDPAHWLLLNGQSADVRTLAATLGVRYREETSGQILHSNIITILNEKGEVVHQQEGLGSDPTETVERMQDLLADNS